MDASRQGTPPAASRASASGSVPLHTGTLQTRGAAPRAAATRCEDQGGWPSPASDAVADTSTWGSQVGQQLQARGRRAHDLKEQPPHPNRQRTGPQGGGRSFPRPLRSPLPPAVGGPADHQLGPALGVHRRRANAAPVSQAHQPRQLGEFEQTGLEAGARTGRAGDNIKLKPSIRMKRD